MTASYYIQTNFVGGEISPRLQGLVNTDNYRQSLARCENFITTPQGSLRRRGGTLRVGEADTANSRLFSVAIANEADTIVEISENVVRLYNDSGRINQTAAQRLRNRLFLAGTREWDIFADPDEIIVIPGVGFSVDVVPNNIARVTQILDPAVIGLSHTLEFTITMTAPDFLANRGIAIELVRTRPDLGGFLMSQFVLTGGAAPAQGESVDVSMNCSLLVGGENEMRIVFRDLPDSAEVAQQYTISNLRIVDTISPPVPYEFTSPYPASELNFLQTATDGASRFLVLANQTVTPQILTVDVFGNDTVYDFGPVLLDNAPSEWSANNNPGAVEFFQGRLIFGGTPEQPASIWGSRVGSLFDFDQQTGTEPIPSDGYEFTLLTNGAIQWLRATKVLLIGTEDDMDGFRY